MSETGTSLASEHGTKVVDLPATVAVDGVQEHLFSVDFIRDERRFTTQIYARDWAHAEEIVAGLRTTATVSGCLSPAACGE